MLLLLVLLIVWLSVTAMVLVLCTVASRADARADEAARVELALARGLSGAATPPVVPGNAPEPVSASQRPRRPAAA
jgi:hypothetical protein